MAVDLLPDAESIARQWVLDDTDIAALVGTNVATRLPADPPFPFVKIQLVRGIRSPGEASLIEALVQFDVYAGRNDFRAASELARTIWDKADKVRNITVTPDYGTVAHVYAMNVQGMRKVFERDTLWARFTVDVLVIMRAN